MATRELTGGPDAEQIGSVAVYANAMEAVRDALALVRVWLERHLVLYGERYNKPSSGYNDLFVDRAEVDAFLSGALGGSPERRATIDELERIEVQLRARRDARVKATRSGGGRLALETVWERLSLSRRLEQDAFVALLALELEPEFLRAFSHAWCDFTQRRMTVGFLAELVGRNTDERDSVVAFLADRGAPARRLEAIDVQPPSGEPLEPFPQWAVRLDQRVVASVCGRTEPGPEVLGVRGGSLHVGPTGSELRMPAELRERVKAIVASEDGTRRRVLLYGPAGVGKRSLAWAAASLSGRRALVADCGELVVDHQHAHRRLLAFLREAAIEGAVPVLAGVDALSRSGGPSDLGADPAYEQRLAALEYACDAFANTVVFTAEQRVAELRGLVPRLVELRVPQPDRAEQQEIWERALGADVRFQHAFCVGDIVGRYSLSAGAILQAADQLRELAARVDRPLAPSDVIPVVRDQLRHRLGSVAVPVVRGFEWSDLVVPTRTLESLHEIAGFVRNRDRIVHEWGFGAKASYGRGTAALFYGPPGTGKTMAASILGTELGMEVFLIDLSRVVDKYVGETEKNLARVFEEGSRAQAILLFDEADSLFASRTKVKSSVDRYANLEVNFLLQRIEAYEGMSILTSNLPEALDEAFKRRIRFKVEFPFPTAEEREQIWRRMVPSSAPLAADVDFPELARRYDLSGAHIRNVVLRSAAIAADGEREMDMAAFVQAANREYAEMGKLVKHRED